MQGFLLLLALLSVITAQTPEQRAKKIVSEMAPSEKYRLLNGVGWANYNNDAGYYIGNTVPNPARGIPSINMQDGPQGFRTTNTSQYGQVTSWPCSLNVASTWDGDLMRQWGTAMGKECRAKGANQLLGPAVNFHRVAKGGRNGEYVTGEDPHLGSVMSANYVIGVQSQKVMATVKHYVTNNQETNRNSESNVVDERTLHEIYLPAFEAAVNAGVASFMCSYNKINGTYACGNPYTLQTVLRGELGFQGWVMSDWWATHGTWPDRGLDQDMPGNYLDDGSKDYYSPENLAKVPINLIDQAAVRILTSMITIGAFDEPVCNTGNGGCNKFLYQVVATNQEHVALARTIGGASAQLLQNNGVLPLDTLPKNAVIAVVGSACNSAYNLQRMTNQWDLGNYYILGGSGRVINPNTVPILAGISTAANQHGFNVIYDGSDDVQKSLRLLQNAQVGIICGGKWSTEGQDRKDLYVDQDSFISQILALRPRNIPMVVALSTPGAVLTDWRGNASAIVNMFLAGEQTGNAWADVLFGHVNPSGRLPVTFPLSEGDVIAPCPGESCTYTERLNVGYRGLVGKRVAFPFGHGLTYTQFGYSWVTQPTTSGCKSNQIACMEIMISNNGKRSGNEIPQVYIDFPGAAGEPTGQLRAFEKVFLLPGATVNIKFGLTARDLSIWDVTSSSSNKWKRIMGKFNVYVGASSRDIRLQGDFTSA